MIADYIQSNIYFLAYSHFSECNIQKPIHFSTQVNANSPQGHFQYETEKIYVTEWKFPAK